MWIEENVIFPKYRFYLSFQQWTKNEHSKEFEVSNLEPDTEYNGTVYMCLLQRRSKAQVFWVKTLAGEAVNSAASEKSSWDIGYTKCIDFSALKVLII